MAVDPDQPTQPQPEPVIEPAAVLERLLDLAHDVSSYLRHHREAAVRASAALLLAASLAACSPSAGDDVVAPDPLIEEVRSGLPAAPGRYPLQPGSLARDGQGVYYFAWQQPGGTAAWNSATTSLAKLAQGQANELEMPAEGDPTLYLTQDTPIPLVASTSELRTPTPGAGTANYSSSSYTHWYPFFTGSGTTGTVSSTTPAYRDPPSQPISSSNSVAGSKTSSAPPAPADRVVGLPHGVSGQSGGTGRGTAASLKSGADVTSGKSGGSGSGGAASAKGGTSSGGVSAARSGGFSGGTGGGFGGGSS